MAAEVPSNMMMKRTRPSLWLTIIMLAWGVVMTLMGVVTSYTGLLIARMALGVAEGGLFPGVTFYITMWYRRHECGYRMALFFSAATLAGAFGGLLARGISEMKGVGGKPGWAWIFILEGILTLGVGKFRIPQSMMELVLRLYISWYLILGHQRLSRDCQVLDR